jgi:hypothetical protein
VQEEVVAQLRQLNRTAPRAKVKKQATKVKSSNSLSSLTALTRHPKQVPQPIFLLSMKKKLMQ